MANTNLIEKVYNEVTKIGRISLLTYVKNGRKNPKNDMRMDSAYYREYASEWYSNCDTLNQLTLTPQAWLVFKYEGYDDDIDGVMDAIDEVADNVQELQDSPDQQCRCG